GSGSESNFQKCSMDADCDRGRCVDRQCTDEPGNAGDAAAGGSAGYDGAVGGTGGSGAGASAGSVRPRAAGYCGLFNANTVGPTQVPGTIYGRVLDLKPQSAATQCSGLAG